ncbi:MAG: hypothetical protein M3Q68_03870 [Actinomycetota bacterium]|nr:hypothetical protein [Actinomycetota bacterium]
MALQGRVLYFWSLVLLDDGDLTVNLARARRSVALAERLGDKAELEQRRTVLATLLERVASAAGPQP